MTRKNPFLPSAQRSGEESRLTSEERQKIYLGEKARSEARGRLAADQKQATAQREKKVFKNGCLAVLVIIVILGYVFCPRAPDVGWAALSVCEGYVRFHLDSPEAADFPFSSIGSTTEQLGNHTYRIESRFDSKNVFGTTMRTKYVCTVRFTGDSKNLTEDALYRRTNWTLIDLQFGRPLPQ